MKEDKSEEEKYCGWIETGWVGRVFIQRPHAGSYWMFSKDWWCQLQTNLTFCEIYGMFHKNRIGSDGHKSSFNLSIHIIYVNVTRISILWLYKFCVMKNIDIIRTQANTQIWSAAYIHKWSWNYILLGVYKNW